MTTSPDATWAAYATSVVTIDLPDARVTVAPASGAPTGGRLPTGLATPVHVVTAWNPGSRRLGVDENTTRNERLRADLMAVGLPVHPAWGCSPDGTWCEDSFAVTGWDRDAVRRLAAAHGQAAVFDVRDVTLAVLATTNPRRLVRSSRVTCQPSPVGQPGWTTRGRDQQAQAERGQAHPAGPGSPESHRS